MYQNQINPNANLVNPYEQNLAIIKNYFKKPIVLIHGILTLISTLASILTSLFLGSVMQDILSLLNQLQNEVNPYETNPFDSVSYSVNPISSITSSIIPILTIVAIFIIYFKSKNPSRLSDPSSGFTILWVISIINLIGTILVIVLILLFSLILMPVLNSVFESSPFDRDVQTAGSAIFGILFFIFFIIAAIILFYTINQLRFYSSVRNSTKNIELQRKGAAIFGILSIIFGGFSVLSSISMLNPTSITNPIQSAIQESNEFGYDFYDFTSLFDLVNRILVLSGISSLISAVASILLGTIAVGYNKYIKNITSSFPRGAAGYAAPVNTNPAGMPQTAQAIPPAFSNSMFSDTQTTNQQQPIQNSPFAPTQNDSQNASAETINPAAAQDNANTETLNRDVSQDNASTGIAENCIKCGAPINDNDLFCRNCGQTIK